MLALGLALAMIANDDAAAFKKPDMTWWKEARFGLFIHWGLYAVPAGKWGENTGYGEWIMDSARIPVSTYEKFKDQFNPTKFNADEWMDLANEAGMKYVVITTKHHDGFALFDSKVSDYDIMATPYKKDIMRQIADAARKNGIVPCWYHSIMDWHHPDYLPRRGWENRPSAGADFDRYNRYLHAQVSELLTNYGPIGVMWFDGEWESTWLPKYGTALLAQCRELAPNTIVNNRVSQVRQGMEDVMGASSGTQQAVGDFGTPEQHIPATGIPGQDWETCMTIGGHWGFNAYETDWKSSTTLIRNLVDIVSKGGNYLLNVGPRADGTFPPQCVDRLKEIGRWMKTNSESIYATEASPFDALPWGRCTQKKVGTGTNLYFNVFDWPKDGRLVVPGLGNTPKRARLLGSRSAVGVSRDGANVILKLPGKPLHEAASCVVLEVEGTPTVYRTPEIVSPGNEFVDMIRVQFKVGEGMEARYTLDGTDPKPTSPKVTMLQIVDECELRVAAFHGGKRVSDIAKRSFVRVKPMAATGAPGTQSGWMMTEYKGNWDRLPDFDSLPRSGSRSSDTVAASADEFVGRRFAGNLRVPFDGIYEFALSSDDGSRLVIGGKVVVDNDGLHGAETKVGRISLARGNHPIVVDWFNKTGGAALTLTWGPIGSPKRPLGGADVGH